MSAGRFGAILTPAQPNPLPIGARWCADNGCFGDGFPGEAGWYDWLCTLPYPQKVCDFAVAPDVVGDAAATLVRSVPWLSKIRDAGYHAALAGQDGLTVDTAPWGEFDLLFLGGSTEWKLSRHARTLAYAARDRDIPVHMGRVNTRSRLRYAAAIGCRSADGTCFTRGPNRNMARMSRWLYEIHVSDRVTARDLHPPGA